MSTIFFPLKNFIDRFKIPPVMRPCFALSACCLDRHPALKINYRDRTETAKLRSARASRVVPNGQSVRAQFWRNQERTPIICSPILFPSPSNLEWAPPGRGAGNGRLSVVTAAAFRASVRGQEIRGVLAGFQVPLPTDLILFRTFPFFPLSGGVGVEEGG